MSNIQISRAQRLDQYVAEQLPLLSRAMASKLVTAGKVQVNGTIHTKPGYKLREMDEILIDFDKDAVRVSPPIDLPIIYEDDDCLVFFKPAGILSHSKGEYNAEATVASWISQRTAAMTGNRAGIVHRLDRATSGVMIGAKTEPAMKWIQRQFAQRRVKKTYVAVVSGHLKTKEAIIDMPIERNPKLPQSFRVGVNGKSAITAYKVIEESPHYSLLELKPTTGRTHQLRVHLKQLGHPIVGDTFYDGEAADRLFLHAASLELTLPNRERKVFTAKVPPLFKELLAHDG